MQTISEINERRSRQYAIVFTVAVHIALGVFLYVSADQKPQQAQFQPAKPTPAAVVKKVNMP